MLSAKSKNISFKILFITAAVIFSSCSAKIKIIDSPISFSQKRIELTKQYIKEHYGITSNNISIVPKIIVLHWTAVGTYDSSFAVFNKETLEGSRPELVSAGDLNVSIQFLVDKDGTIHRLMPETWLARHCIGLNYESIGIENVGGVDDVDDLTDAQIKSNIQLVEYLAKKYPTVKFLIGHLEYRDFEGTKYWLEKDSTYRTVKYDPGERFMNAVRKGVADLNLKGPSDIAKENTIEVNTFK
ncbi:MAG: N-acetylmuramoyl-L-alanine amidase [Bacteroidetes bacterium]|nr:N-acetylmuramoyl-L-alanine amidase [Bacteroidota bacterium]